MGIIEEKKCFGTRRREQDGYDEKMVGEKVRGDMVIRGEEEKDMRGGDEGAQGRVV